jgi:hypothetical protein
VREFRASWGVLPSTATKNMSVVKAFFEFCHANEWTPRNPARMVNNQRGQHNDPRSGQKLPFSDEEPRRMYDACDTKYGKRQIQFSKATKERKAQGPYAQYRARWTGQDVADFISVSVYTGLRISDVSTFGRDSYSYHVTAMIAGRLKGTHRRATIRHIERRGKPRGRGCWKQSWRSQANLVRSAATTGRSSPVGILWRGSWSRRSKWYVFNRKSRRRTPRVESFHGRLREECLNVSWFQNLFDVKRKIAAWRTEYNEERPHSSLGYLTPTEFATQALTSYGKDACQNTASLENAEERVSHFPTAPATAAGSKEVQ